jgi:hypothetical protein
MAVSGNRELASLVDWSDDRGWASYSLAEVETTSRMLYFPVVEGIVDDLRAELFVQSHSLVDATTIDLFLVATGGRLVAFETDPVPLCAGAIRSYDLGGLLERADHALEQGSVVSLRVTSTNRAVAEPPPISGAIVLGSSRDQAAYVGADHTSLLAGINRGSRRGSPAFAVAGARLNHGDPPTTTVIVAQGKRGSDTAMVYADFYDAAGSLVVDDAFFLARGDGAIVIDPAAPLLNSGGGLAGTLPEGFVGTAEVWGTLRNALVVTVIETGADAGRRVPGDGGVARAPLSMYEGLEILVPPTPRGVPPPDTWTNFVPLAERP